MNENGRKLIGLCMEKKLSVGNTSSGKEDIHKFTWTIGVDDRKSLLDLLVAQKEDRNKLLDVNVLRGAGWEILGHHLVISKIRCLRRWTGRVVNMEERYEMKERELRKVTCKTEYEEKLKQRVGECTAGSSPGGGWNRNGECLRRQTWKWERKCVGQREKGVSGGVRKLGG